MNTSEARALITQFYDVLTLPASKDVRGIVERIASPAWRSFAGENVSKSRDEFIQLVTGFGKLIPDLRWDMKEVLSDGNRIIVRSEASGTPAGDFMGVPHRGKRFSIMTIDIHTVEGGVLVLAHHVEDWASAIRQLQAG